jgi:transcriptional regulator of acetoin/glycerol metabolism
MTDEERRLLEEVRGLVVARTLIDDALTALVRTALSADVDRSALALALGIDRSTLYRRYRWTIGRE